ncbi:MAG: hypothetical protein IJT66_01600, partial [Clostridia bacterium]|nr:hypothetical protein [Clostridia bacterium]
MIASCISAVFTVIALGLFFGFTPESVTADFLRLITPKDSLRNEARAVRGNKKRHRLYAAVMKLKNALEATGGSKRFSVVCFCSLLLFAAGAAFTVGVGNLFLLPAVSVGLAMIPFLYTAHMLSVYERQTKEELETALSVLT